MVKTGEITQLVGEYTGKVVAGHRVALPAPLRKQLGTNSIITKGYEGCLLIVPADAWQKLIEPMQSRSFLDRNVRDSMRFLVGSAYQMASDAQGRVVVPESLREYSKIAYSEKREAEVVFVGLVNWVEVWEKKSWLDRSNYLDDNADAIAQELLATKSEGGNL